VIIQQDGAEHAALGIEVLGQGTFQGRFGHWIAFALYSPKPVCDASTS
jgi:hypothetical protein